MTKIKVGCRYKSNNCGWFEVIEYTNHKEVMVKFEKTGYVTSSTSGNIRGGMVKDRLLPSVYGMGFIGEGKYASKRKDKANSTWWGMLSRCYNEKYQEKCPTYKGCFVNKEWLNFQNFAKYYEDNYKEGYQLDKDLLFKGNKEYSSETCVFVPQYLNKFTLDSSAKRRKFLVGVTLCSYSKLKPYRASIRSAALNSRIHLGLFATEEEAYQVWLSAKLQQALEYKQEMDEIDPRIYANVVEIIKEM